MIKSNAGRAIDLGNTFYRSKMERNVARFLKFLQKNGEIIEWIYEPKPKFDFIKNKKRGVTSYLPDFKITNKDWSVEYYEVKGYMDKKSQVKLNCMARYYPDVKITVIDSREYAQIKKIKNLIKKKVGRWED